MHAGGTAHIVPVPGVMGVKDFALNYSNILERYKFERFGRTFFDKGRIIVRPFYVWELILILESRTARDIKFMARERNGSILMSKQVGCSSLSPLVNLSRYDWNLRMEERT